MNSDLAPQGKLITAILPKGRALPLLKVLQERGVNRANFAFARGFDIHDPEGKQGLPDYEEKEIVTVVAQNESEAQDLFVLVYEVGEVNCLGGGLVYQQHLNSALPFTLPDVEQAQSE
jgi:hypothetical protein